MNGPYGLPLQGVRPIGSLPQGGSIYSRLAPAMRPLPGPSLPALMGAAGESDSAITQPGPAAREVIGTGYDRNASAIGRIGGVAGNLMGAPGLGAAAGIAGAMMDRERANRDLEALGVGPAIGRGQAALSGGTGILGSLLGVPGVQQAFNEAVVSRMAPDEYVSALNRAEIGRQFGMTPQALAGILGSYSGDYYGGGADYGAGVGAPTGYDGGGYAGSRGGFDV